MRLTQVEIDKILTILKKYSSSGEIFLHGSRLDDIKKGGDIDLFFIVNDSEINRLSSISYKISAELSLNLNEQRVDLLILGKTESQSHTFFHNSEKKLLS